MRLDLELAIRFLHRRGGRLLRGTALGAMGSTALGTAALVITLALMAGYTEAIATALQIGTAHIIGYPPGPIGIDEATSLAETLKEVEGVRTVQAAGYYPVLVEDPAEPSSPLPIIVKAVSQPPSFTGLESWPAWTELPGVLGHELARSLNAAPGASFRLLLPPEPGGLILPSIPMRGAGTFKLAYSEIDSRWLVAPLDQFLRMAPGHSLTGIELMLDDPMRIEPVREAVAEALPGFIVTDWRETYGPLFANLQLQTVSLFVVLSLIVMVSSFQVSSSLVILTINKRRTCGMIQALGGAPAFVRRALVLAGALLGGCGVAAGMLLGAAASFLLSHFRIVRFPEGLAQVYRVDHIDFLVRPTHLVAIACVCAALILLASFWPAWRASRMDPVKALKAV